MADDSDSDPIWTSSSTARHIQDLGNVEKDIIHLLSLASSSISLLTLPQTDGSNDTLPTGDERSEQFVLEVTQYFQKLDVRKAIAVDSLLVLIRRAQAIHLALRSVLAQLRLARISPSSIDASPPDFVPSTFGVGSPNAFDNASLRESKPLQEVRVERDAWKHVLDSLQRIKGAQSNT